NESFFFTILRLTMPFEDMIKEGRGKSMHNVGLKQWNEVGMSTEKNSGHLHLADAFIQSDLHMCDLQCIHIFTLMAHCTSGAIRGSVSCSRTLRQWESNYQPSDYQTTSLPPEPLSPPLHFTNF